MAAVKVAAHRVTMGVVVATNDVITFSYLATVILQLHYMVS